MTETGHRGFAAALRGREFRALWLAEALPRRREADAVRPRSVMVGFVNALAILIFLAQVPELIDVPWPVYPPRRYRCPACRTCPSRSTR
jgi:hypothetical protein